MKKQNLLERRLAELCSHAKQICEEAVITVSTEGFEPHEDAVIEIVVPESFHEEMFDTISNHAGQIWLEDCLWIVTMVFDKETQEVAVV